MIKGVVVYTQITSDPVIWKTQTKNQRKACIID